MTRRIFITPKNDKEKLSLSKEAKMRLKVTDRGITIPKEWFEGTIEVEVEKQGEAIVVRSVGTSYSIWDLGQDPVDLDEEIDDAAVNHDKYIYNFYRDFE